MTKLYYSIVTMTLMIGGAIQLAVTTAKAEDLTEALRVSLLSSKSLAAARQGWIAARETIGTKTTTSDLSARLNTTGSGSYTDSKNGGGFTEAHSISAGITVSKNFLTAARRVKTPGLPKSILKLLELTISRLNSLLFWTL